MTDVVIEKRIHTVTDLLEFINENYEISSHADFIPVDVQDYEYGNFYNDIVAVFTGGILTIVFNDPEDSEEE